MSTLTLTSTEAVAVHAELRMTVVGCAIGDHTDTREQCESVIRRLQLEVAIRDAGGWWGEQTPGRLALDAEACPDYFTLPAEGVAALVELLPFIIAEIRREETYPWSGRDAWRGERLADERERRALIEAIAADLGVDIAELVA